MLRFVALSTGVTIGVTWLVPPATAEPAPSARDVERSERAVEDRAAEVGRTKAMLAQADGELDRLAVAAESAIERYNGERVRLERAQQAYRDAQARLVQAGRRVAESQAALATFAAQAYQHNTGYDQMSSAVAGHGGPQGFMDRAGMVEVLAKQRAGALRQVEAAENVADVFRKQAKGASKEQGDATRRAEDAKRRAQDAVDTQQASVQRITAEKQKLERRLSKAESHAAQVKRARERALEAAEARSAYEGSGRPAAGLALSRTRGLIVARAALRWLGTPYSWGGGTADGPSFGTGQGAAIFGFDCSGLSMHAWAQAGVRLDHWTGTQWTSGPHVPVSELRPGDLVFFAKDTSNPDTIHHVGIYLAQGRMVEAPYTGARVRISSIHRNDLIGATRPSG
ncbi:NlpC/P60 family protein [Actinomadura terrae]|uniref:NlpC/P60 family protein n=1 Tax=Actinomadura terrae TaxID=604353 RepID=UPI001FA72ED9|nr:NlpC/P60 family protein [Actinomadura terrae]